MTFEFKPNGILSGWNMNTRRRNSNLYYSPGVDRLFMVDNMDPYTAFEVAQILSSKIPGIAILVAGIVAEQVINNEDCHLWTLNNKNIYAQGASILFSRQIPAFRKLREPGMLAKVDDLPLDYQTTEGRAAFAELQRYARFVLTAWHAAKLCEMHCNFLPMAQMANNFFQNEMPDSFERPADSVNGNTKTGITQEIRRILYYSLDQEEALASIEQLWLANNTPHSKYWRILFYQILGLPIPDSIQSTDFNLDQYSSYLL